MKPILTKSQIARLANIFDNAGQVCLASIVITPLVSDVEKSTGIVVLLGIVVTVSCWWISLKFERIASKWTSQV